MDRPDWDGSLHFHVGTACEMIEQLRKSLQSESTSPPSYETLQQEAEKMAHVAECIGKLKRLQVCWINMRASIRAKGGGRYVNYWEWNDIHLYGEKVTHATRLLSLHIAAMSAQQAAHLHRYAQYIDVRYIDSHTSKFPQISVDDFKELLMGQTVVLFAIVEE